MIPEILRSPLFYQFFLTTLLKETRTIRSYENGMISGAVFVNGKVVGIFRSKPLKPITQ